MIYRLFGKTKNLVSRLGFGGLRLPSYADDDKRVDREKSVDMLCRSFELGVNYVDTAYIYRGGQSEQIIGEALKYTKKKIYISTKFSLFGNPQTGDYTKMLEESLKRMDLPYIDYYHFHALNRELFDNIVIPQFFLNEAIKAKEQGLIKHISFSFHDTPEAMRYIIDKSEIMETVLCQYNIIDQSNASMMKYAKDKGLGVAVMGPLAGGKFVVADEFLNTAYKIKLNSTAEIGLRFVLNNPNVDIVLSGIKSKEMLEENSKTASINEAFSKEEKVFLEKMILENKVIADCYCTECGYCMPCPVGINIPYIFRLLNFYKVDGLIKYAKEKFEKFNKTSNDQVLIQFSTDAISIGTHPKECLECNVCISKCPQQLEIPKKLKEALIKLS